MTTLFGWKRALSMIALLASVTAQSEVRAKEKMAASEVTANPDYDFASMLRMHNQADLDMAKAELMSGKDPVLLEVARKLIASKKKERAQLDQWLAHFRRFD